MTSTGSPDSQVNQAFQIALQRHRDKWESDYEFPESATPEELYSEIKQHEDDRRRSKLHGYTSRISDVIKQFETFFSLVDALVSMNPIAGLAWGGIRFIMRSVSNHLAHFERILDVLVKIGQSLHFYGRYATAIYKGNDRVMTVLADVYGDILTVFMTVKKTFFNSRKRMLDFPIIVIQFLRFGGAFDDVVASIEQRHTMLNNEVEHADREANHADREEHVMANRRGEMDHLLDLLHFEDFDCSEKHSQSLGKKMSSDSGAWLLESPLYMNWRDSWGVNSGSLFWLHGPPGSGKTVLTSFAIEDLKINKYAGSQLLSFYCDYKFPEKSKAEYLFRSLLGQLLLSFDHSLSQAPSPVHDIIAEFSRTRSVASISLANVLGRLITCSCCEHVTIVIDALDECEDRESILCFLHQLPSSIHLFISSRDEHDIECSFRSHSVLREQMIKPDDIEHDIRNYLVMTFDKHLEKYPSFVRDHTFLEEIIETLVKNADGMFLCASFQVMSILECNTNYDIRKALQELPNGLRETFIRSLKRIDERPERSRILLRRILRLVVCFKHIELDSLVQLVNIAEMGADWDPDKTINDPLKLISSCGHLISTTLFSGKLSVTLTHLSVKQFLTSDPHSFDPDIKNSFPQYHCYPLRDAFMETARIFLKKRQIRGCPYLHLWRDECLLVSRWRKISDLEKSTSDFLSTVFNAPLNENARPGPSLVFPNATHVTLINCRFMDVDDEYYILTSSQPAEFSRGPYILKDVFPRLTQLTIIDSEIWIASCGIHVLQDDDQRATTGATTEPVGHPYPMNATHVTVMDIDFIFATGSNWTIYPGVETIPGVTLTAQQRSNFNRNLSAVLVSPTINAIPSWLICVGRPDWNEISSKITPLRELSLEDAFALVCGVPPAMHFVDTL